MRPPGKNNARPVENTFFAWNENAAEAAVDPPLV
jgi:hypothetical protein